MSLTASDNGNAEFAITPAGQYIGRCYKIIDLGTQTTSGQYGVKDQHKVMISWELLDEAKMEDGRPFSVTQWYTVSLHEKSKMRADLESWRGRKFTEEELKGFDLNNVLGAYCMIQVVHDETGKYANVQTIMAYKGNKPEPVNPNVVFDIDEPDMDVFNKLSENMQAKIVSTPEWKSNHQSPAEPAKAAAPVKEDVVHEPAEGEPISLDDIPF